MKSELYELIRSELRVRLGRLTQAALDAHAAATDPGSKAEGKYDTRSLEASYLARGQAQQVAELGEAVGVFERLVPEEFAGDEVVGPGALVEVDVSGESSWFLLAPVAGGLVVELQGMEVTLLTPESALYQKLLGLSVGDVLDDPVMMVMEVG